MLFVCFLSRFFVRRSFSRPQQQEQEQASDDVGQTTAETPAESAGDGFGAKPGGADDHVRDGTFEQGQPTETGRSQPKQPKPQPVTIAS